ncbi:MAG: serine/threonine protein kinase [Opitutaceae bacterium]|nr:serine/threonine protein kinase [Opitutaceae bacterium]
MNTIGQREEDLFDAARQITDPARRAAFLDFSCTDDPALRARIEALLTAEDQADDFFAEGATLVTRTDASLRLTRTRIPLEEPPPLDPLRPHAEETIGARIGRYKLVQKIGEGGCGVVYLAEQEEPVRRHVALKIIRLGMETRTVIARFEAERQALAMMDHPNIARVFDAGETERGSPYFVMEHVRGVKITDYCDQNRLTLPQRLDLFIQICHAIQHAHQKGIVHGDIKPSNIMVALHDGVPVPKVIDFGISKATEARLSDRIPFTAYAQLIGTPAYMSPEQIEMGGVDVDTRSDIYSLGVLLFELLTGRTPFDGKKLLDAGLEEMRRQVREIQPPRPSALLHGLDTPALQRAADARRARPHQVIARVRGDLDDIVLKTLEKDRRRRYETANGLAMDVQRHLNFEPVTARHHGPFYRLRKLARRNRAVFAGVGAVATALIIGTTTSTWLFLREREARQRAVAAEQQQARLRQQAETREQITSAALLVSQERHDEADAILADVALTEPTMEGAAVFRAVGEWHAIHGRWKLAADRFAALLRINQLEGPDVSTLDYLERGPVLIELGDMPAYDRFRREAVARFAGSSTTFADRIVKISLLAPADDKLLDTMEPLAALTTHAMADAEAAGQPFEAGWRAMSLALFEFRRGQFEQAAELCRKSLASPDGNAPRTATVRAIHAMTLVRLGRSDEARAELVQAEEMVDAKFRGRPDRGTPVQGFWFDWAFARILLREAQTLVGPAGAS